MSCVPHFLFLYDFSDKTADSLLIITCTRFLTTTAHTHKFLFFSAVVIVAYPFIDVCLVSGSNYYSLFIYISLLLVFLSIKLVILSYCGPVAYFQ